MGRLLTIALIVAAIGGVLGAVIGANLLATIAPLSEYSGWFIAVCAALTAAATASIAVIAMRGKRSSDAGLRVRLAVVLFGGAAGAAMAPTLFGDRPAGRQLLCVAGGALLAACLMGLVARIRGQTVVEPRDGSPRRWFQFTLGSLLALTFLTSVALSLWVRGPMARRRVLAAIEAGGGGRVRYASRAPEWIVQSLGSPARGFFDEVDTVDLHDPADADLAPLAAFTRLQSLQLSGNRSSDKGLKHLEGLKQLGQIDVNQTDVTPAAVQRLEEAWRRRRE